MRSEGRERGVKPEQDWKTMKTGFRERGDGLGFQHSRVKCTRQETAACDRIGLSEVAQGPWGVAVVLL